VSTAHAPSSLFEEIAELFASVPSADAIVAFRPSQASIRRASELLELNRQGLIEDELLKELNQFEQAELLLRLVKARIHANQLRTHAITTHQ